MGWSVYMSVTRGSPLSAAERRLLIELVAEHNQEPWALDPFDLLLPPPRRRGATLAIGTIKLPTDQDHPDIERMLGALTALRELLDGSTCAVTDDLSLIEWQENAYVLVGAAAQPEMTRPDTEGWLSGRELVRTLRPSRARRATVTSAASSPLADAIALLEALPRKRSATKREEVKAREAVLRVADDPGLAPAVLSAWRAQPTTIERMGSLRAVLSPLIAAPCPPWLQAELVASIARAGQTGEQPRVVAAVFALREVRAPFGLAATLAVLRRFRDKPNTFADEPFEGDDSGEPLAQRLMWFLHLGGGELSPSLCAAVMATSVLGLAAPASTHFLVRAAIAHGGTGALPYLARIPADHPHVLGLPYALPNLVRREPAARTSAIALCARSAGHPMIEVRLHIAHALFELCGEPAMPLLERALALAIKEDHSHSVERVFRAVDGGDGPLAPEIAAMLNTDAPLADPLEDLVANDRWRRKQGLKRYERAVRGTAGEMVPMMLYEALTAHLPHYETVASPSWSRAWTELPSELQRRSAAVERAA